MLTNVQCDALLQKMQKDTTVAELMNRGINWQDIVKMVLAILAALGVLPAGHGAAQPPKEEKEQKAK